MPTPIPVERPREGARLDNFTGDELAVIQYALVALADSTLADAEREEIDREALPAAGATFLLANRLAYEIDDREGKEHPPLEMVELMAACIAEGDAPVAAKAAAEAVAE